ncbi:MARTX multifunctional-autoprocessing repeats-in-toxin holotoxin RtxA [Xenorhabdus sp. Flor]|uniref:MARTX multifunctional-autoprocessing repeats-in-toxin holotoxin RtxA n=1 Tax=Xenorhabdus cabanillasii TaxID=351673 RepID=UPI00198C7019|nr:MARTX multifunctional-autoprocessing repeats-in-toxin holotoxin RtxA [Xenorhabdus sp. Flor]MBD2813618.1 MARTX multifunctional-autoprocessing repeats-in-toxin holotoxin RtxA [Xenorhabdus sp. Flor]
MGKSSNRSAEYFFTGRYEDDNDGNTIHAIGVGGVINAYGGNDYIVVGSIGATINTTWGHDTIVGGAGYLNVNDTSGSLTVKGGSGYTAINKTHNGTIEFAGAAGGLEINHMGENGAINYSGISGYNGITRKGVQGDILFKGAGGYNNLYSDVEKGDIHFVGAGGYNKIVRKGSDNDFSGEGIEYSAAAEIVLKNATMNGSWIGSDHQVSGLKSTREPNTYLFAFADNTYTKINKVQLRNDPVTGKLIYHSTSWYKEGNHLKELEKQDISVQGGFVDVNTDGAYTLSNLVVEHQKPVTIQAVAQKLTENEWMNYANGIQVNASEIILSDAKMGGYAIYQDGSTVDVKAVKSNRMPNTYVYAKKLGIYTKVVVVELRNDPETGILQYIARPWYKEGDYTTNVANEVISAGNGYNSMGTGGYSLSDLHYSARMVHKTTERVAKTHEYSDQSLFPVTERRESSGDVRYEGAGGGNVIKSNVTKGNVYFNGAGIANIIEHTSAFGNTEFNGAGGANVIIKKGKEGNLSFNGAGVANVLLHQAKRGDMEVNAGGAANVLVRVGDGRYLAHLLAVGNISIHKGNGNSRVSMGGGFNTHTQIGHGDAVWSGVGGANVLTKMGQGHISSILAGGANILTKIGEGDLEAGLFGGANIITHISDDSDTSNPLSSDTKAVALGGANILTKKGKGNLLAVMGGGANVLTHVGDGTISGIMLGGANILTKVGNGDTTGIMLGLGNVLTHVGDGQTLGVMAAAGNIFTKVGDGDTIAAMLAVGNIFTHVGEGNAFAIMAGGGNIFTKVGNGDALALMLAFGNVFTHIGDGTSVALMIAKANIATKAGNGDALAAMIGKANIFTQIGHGPTFAAMIGGANVLTKVGNGLTAALMVGKANIFTHVGEGTSIGLFAGTANIMTKVGDGTTLAAMFGKANVMTHVGDGLTGVLALGKANIVTKVGNDFMGVVAASEANVVTHVGEGTTAALLSGKGNVLTKVGDGTAVGLLVSKIGNIMTHVGDGTTVGFAKGEANIITKVGNGSGVNAVWGKANILTHYGDGDRYNFAKGEANIITKVGEGQEITVVQGQANIITHVGNGDDYTGAWGKANVMTKVGDGRNVVLAKGDANIVTQIGEGDSFNALWSQGNLVTKVGDGTQVTAAKGKGNIVTTIGNGLSVTATHGDLNVNTKVGDGVSVNVAWGKFNVNTRVGDGLNVSVMKGTGNANIRVGDGLNINASYARNNVAVQVGNGDFYSLAVAESNTQSNKLGALFDNIKQTLLGTAGSQGINYLVNGEEANTSGTHKGRGAIDLPEISSLNGFRLTEIDEVTSELQNNLQGSVSGVDTPDTDAIQNALSDGKHVYPDQVRNLITNGDFEQGSAGWQSTNGVEADYSAESYGLNKKGHGERVSELDTNTNTRIYQDIGDLTEGESITVSFDFARRTNISADNGMCVLWNDKIVFSVSAGDAAWSNKTLTLKAQEGSNRLEFAGTGRSDGLGYVLDNVVAQSELSGSGITKHVKQDKAARNALQDKEKAEADRQRLEQERDKQLAAVSGTQAQLENTDLDALETNGQSQRDSINDEAQAITKELMAKTKGLEALNDHATHHGQSGSQWRDQFADGLLGNLQSQLNSAKETAQQQLEHSQQASSERLGDIKDAVTKSESGVLNGEQNHQQSLQDIEKTRADIELREQEAIARMKRAEQAAHDGKSAVQKAEQRGQHAVSAAEIKTAQVQSDAKGAKLDGNSLPNRTQATGGGLSVKGQSATTGKAFETTVENHTEKANSHIDSDSFVETEEELSMELQYLEEDLNELNDAKEALDRLQINAGVRIKKRHTHLNAQGEETAQPSADSNVSVNIPVNTSIDTSAGSIADMPVNSVRKEQKISGLDLSGLKALGGIQAPVLRQLQREGLVGEIRLLDKAAKEYQGVSPDEIGRRLTEAGISVKARFDLLSLKEQEKLLALHPDRYKPDTLIDLNIKTSAIDNLLNQALPFYGLRTERNLLVRESDEEGFEVRPWPGKRGEGSESDSFKTIIVEDQDDTAQIKATERFILANYDNYAQLPDKLYLVDDRIVSHDNGRTRILAEKVEGSWNYQPKTDLMSVSELQEAAYVKGKIRGDSYQNVLDALRNYENVLQENKDYDLHAIEKLAALRHQVDGYLLGHPDSERAPALKNLLSQINVRIDESTTLAESSVESSGKGSFSELYDKLGNANLKDSKHLYIDEQGDFVTRGKSNIQIATKAESAENAIEQVKASITREYGQSVTETVFSNLNARDLAKDGKGIDVSGLKKIHQAIEQQLSPISATLFIWKPSDHSRLGHAALQIGHGRIEVSAENAGEFNEKNYVSWWPKGGKSTNIGRIFNVSSAEHPDVRLRWRDLSQPAGQSGALELDVSSEENDNFGLQDGARKLERFIEKLQAAKGVDAKFEDISEGFAMAALANPNLLKSAGIPEHISRPFIQQWEDSSMDMFEVGKRFAQALRTAAKQQTPELTEKRVANVIRQFAEYELSNIQDFKASEPDQGRVFRINLVGLDAAAMQAEWHKISQNPDARYQLLTDNCSSIVARVLKAGGADQVIGHKWRPHFGVWTPTELFNYAQALQEAQIEHTVSKPNRLIGEDLTEPGNSESKDKNKALENVAIDNDGTPPHEREPLNPIARFLNNELYGAKDARRNINEDTQILLDHAVNNGTADKVTLRGDAGRLTGYYHISDKGTDASAEQGTAEQKTAKKVVLFIHGSGSSAEEQADAIQGHYQKQGVDMLAVNMRGYGLSDGHPSEKGLYQDARTMFHYLVNDRGIKPENIIIHGYSMGGAVAADLARYAEHSGQPVSGLLLDRPMPSMTKAITAHEVSNPAGSVGALAKAVNGQFSVEKNLQGISKQTPIMLLTDNEGLGAEGEKLRTKLKLSGYQVSGEHTFYGHEASNRLMKQFARQIVTNLFDVQRQPDKPEILKDIWSELKNVGEALKPQVNKAGITTYDIRTTEDFLAGYKQGHAKQIVDGFRSDMSIRQLADLLVKGNWSAEQKGALTWEIESRALKVTFQEKAEKFNLLFRDVASKGVADTKASEQLVPQTLFLNLSNDGYGGRCDPLSKLVLVAKQLENDGQDGVARKLLEKMYSTAAVLSNPDLYSETELANANKFLGSLAALHARNPMYGTFIKVWEEKLEDERALTVNGVINKVTAANAEGKPVLLELDAPGHAMSAWAKGSGENRVYGFYDPNVGIIEFSSAEKFGDYMTRFFGKSGLNMENSYKMPKNDAGEAVFYRVVVMDGGVLATYKPTHNISMRDILDLNVFDETPMKARAETEITDMVKSPLKGNDSAKTNLLEKALYSLFDAKSGGKELDEYSLHFNQGESLINNLKKLIPEIGDVRLTNGNHVESKEFLEGLCLALSARYMMEERVHGSGGGKKYMVWLMDAVKAYNDNTANKNSDINSVEASLLNQYRRQYIGSAIEDLLSIQYTQTQYLSDSQELEQKANEIYGGKLKANGLTGKRIDWALQPDISGYELEMDKLRNVNKTTYMSFMSEDHAMAITVHKEATQTIWSFYDPNFGIKSFNNYENFRSFMDSFYKGIITGYKFGFPYRYEASKIPGQSFYVNYNAFEDGTITDYDGIWQQAREGEQPYVLRALKEQGKAFQLGSDVTGRVVDYRDDAVTLEVVMKRGQEVQKVQIDVESNNFKQAANLVQSNINKLVVNPATSKLTLNAAGEISITEEVKSPLKGNLPESVDRVVDNKNVESWERVTVTPQAEGGESRFDGQIIIQTENDPTVAKAAASLAGKHPDTSVIVQLDADGKYRVVYGDPTVLSGKLRWQIVGHGRDESTQHLTRMAGYSADELALKLKQFSTDFKQAGQPEHISLVGCSLINDDKREGFARHFISALDRQGIRTTVSARSSEVAVDHVGHKHTRNAQDQWVHKLVDNKIVLGWNDNGEVEARAERVRRGISEGDIILSRVGHTDLQTKAKGAIAKNTETFHAPKPHENGNNVVSSETPSKDPLSYSGNIQVQAGDGEFTAINWGTTNVGIKVGTGGFKSLAFGDNNVMVHIGHGDSKHSVDIAGYQAFEGAQLFVGNRNVSFNLGRSNDLIVMLEKSIPTPPLVNPFDGAARISGVLQDIASSQGSSDWLTEQDQQWSLEGAKKYVSDLSGLDLTSSVKYETLTEFNTENERSSRGLKSDIESTLNKKYNQWLGGAGNKPEPGSLSRADKFRQANEKLAFNFAVGGQGADIQVTTGNWNFMFGDNIQSILDTNLGSLFGLMTQQYTSTGMAKTTFTFSPTDLPRQIKNKLLGNLAGVKADTTLADIFGVDYTPDGRIVSRSGQPVDGVAILREMLEIIGEFSGDQLKAFTDPEKLLDGLKAGLNTGADGIKSFAESHGLKAKTPADAEEGKVLLSEDNQPTGQTVAEQPERAFGFNALNLPNLFVTLFNQDKQAEMKSLVANLKENLTADLLNMKDKTFDFLRNSGHLQGDGDIHISLGNYNFNWSGDGKDLGAYLGDNNNVWGGRGGDVFYSVGTSNIFTGGEGNDVGVLMGRENIMFGDAGNDVAVLAGRINYAYMGDGNDQVFAFGENGVIQGDKGRDYIVASGNFNRIDAGEDQDYVVTIGNNNQADLGEGDDFATVFGNYNRIDGNSGSNSIKLMGYYAEINGGTGNDHLIADVVSKFSQFNGGDGDDLLVLGGYQNHFKGETGVNSFVVSGNVIDNVVEDIKQGDKIVFNDINWQNLWFQCRGYDLVLLTNRNVRDSSVQGQFETIGSVTFKNYFNGNRADIVTQMGDKDPQGEREYKALSANAVDTLVQAMSGFSPNIGDSGFIDSLDSQTKSTIITAWTDTTNRKSKLA